MKNIKNFIIVILVAVIILGIITVSNFHSRVAMVTEIDTENNLITVTCGNGNIFSFYTDIEDWCCGDLCSLIMYDKGTDIVYDDIIVSARYDGYVELFEEIENTIK